MKLSVRSLAVTGAILWGAGMLLTGIANLIWPSYALAFLQMVDSIYPGYHAGQGFGSVVVGVFYAVVDGAVCGLLFGWVYNRFAGGSEAQSEAGGV